MKFIETTVFTKQIKSLLGDSDYRQLQNELLVNPRAGDIIPGSGGIQKLRWRTTHGGKRGGVRVIYYWITKKDIILFLLAYSKSEQDDFSREQLMVLKKLVTEELK